MTAEYELDGIIHQEPLPRIALVNFSEGTCNELVEKSHNVYSYPSVIQKSGLRRITALRPAHEVEILIVRDSAELVSIPAAVLAGSDTGMKALRLFDNQIKLAKGPTLALNAYCRGVFHKGGLCVFLVSGIPGNLLDHSGLGMTTDINNKAETHSASFKPISSSGYEFLSSFVERWRKIPERYVGIRTSIAVSSFLEDTGGNKLVVLHKNFGAAKSGVVLCLPDYGDRSEILDSLLKEVLPELAPHLFPHRFDGSWQNQPIFAHHCVNKLEAEKTRVRRSADETIRALDQEIETFKKEDRWLLGLLLTGDDPLKDAVRKGLEEILRFAGIEGTQVLDVDDDPSLRDGSGQKLEDLRVSIGGKHFLIDIAGNDSPLKEGRINQLDKHKKFFLAANPLASQDTQSVLIANYNKRGGTDPSKRGEMFGSGTAQAQSRLVDAGHTAMSTYDLFRLIRAVQRADLALTADDVVSLLTAGGILDLEQFIKQVQAKMSARA